MYRYEPDNDDMCYNVLGDYVKTKEVVEFLKQIKEQLDVLDDKNLSKLDDTRNELKDMIEDLS